MNVSPDNLHPNVGCCAHPDGPSGTAVKINRATLHKRTAITDPHYYRPAVVGIRNSNPRPKRKGPVRGGHGARVKPFPGRGSSSREFFSIVTRNLRLGGAL